MNKIRGIKLLGIGIVLVIIQSFLQQYDTFREIYSKYVGYLVPVIYAFFITIFLEPIVTIIEKKIENKKNFSCSINDIFGICIGRDLYRYNSSTSDREYKRFIW